MKTEFKVGDTGYSYFGSSFDRAKIVRKIENGNGTVHYQVRYGWIWPFFLYLERTERELKENFWSEV